MKALILCFALAVACTAYAGEGCDKCQGKKKGKKAKAVPTATVTGSNIKGNSTLTVVTLEGKALSFDGLNSTVGALSRYPGVSIRGRY